MTQPLAATFRAYDPGLACSDPELEAQLGARISAARLAWPALSITDEAFVAFIAQRSSAAGLPAQAHAAELFLACACAGGDAAALTAFHAAYEPIVMRVLQRRAAGHGSLEDVKQEVFSKLLVAGDGSQAKVAEYRGMGPLRSWVARVSVTTLLMTRRSQHRRREQPTEDEDPIVDPILNADPELHYLKERYQGAVAKAIVSALGKLGDRERVLLRLHLCERLSVDKLGTMYAVNRATAARWLVSARKALLEGTRQELQTTLGITDRECESILNLVQSQLDVSVARHLAS